MSVSVMLYLFGKPGQELDEGGEVTAAQLRDLGTELNARLQNAADIVGKLTETGWEAEMGLYDIYLHHPYVRTEQEARMRLDELGIDPEQVFIDEFEDEEELEDEVGLEDEEDDEGEPA